MTTTSSKNKINFKNILKNDYGFEPDDYLKEVRKAAKKTGYDPNSIIWSDDNNGLKKLCYYDKNTNHRTYFGSSINKDFIIYKHLEKSGIVPKGTAKNKRRLYLARATKIKGKSWKNDKFSPNNLAIHVLW